MITLFRRIRERLVASGSVTKYLLYAVGEILLVVVGILIALQINTWSENEKRIEQESYLINELTKELEANLILIEEDMQTNQSGLNGTLEFLKLIQLQGLEEDPERSDSLVVHLFYINTFEAVSGVIDDVISTGKLDLIRDDSLRNELANWAGNNIDLYDDIVIRNNYLFDIIIPFVSKNYPLINSRDKYGDVVLQSSAWEGVEDADYPVNLNEMYSNEMESHLYNHALNQEYVIYGTRIFRAYVESLLDLLKKQKIE